MLHDRCRMSACAFGLPVTSTCRDTPAESIVSDVDRVMAALMVCPCCVQTFNEMLLLKRGGSVIYNGPLGDQSGAMIAYFESIPGVQPIAKGYSTSVSHHH